MKILVSTDGSGYNKTAVEEFACKPFPAGTQILVVSAYNHSSFIMSTAAPMGGLTGYYEQLDSSAKKYGEDAVENTAAILRNKNAALLITTHVIKGSPKHVILEESEKFGADLIVVGSHGHGSLERFLLGSVSQAVAMHADCSVLIIRKRGGIDKNEKDTNA